jgi:GNAT superfamily N-acetyltransferase
VDHISGKLGDMEFRLGTEGDVTELAHLRWDFRMEGGDELPAVSKEEFITACETFLKQGLDSGSRAYWVAVDNSEIVSHIFVQKVDMVPRPCKIHDQFGCITNNYTKPQHRNKGIGSQLMQRVKQWAQEHDLELLIVWPSEQAVRFYEQAGFKMENDVMELRLRDYYSASWHKLS